MKKEQTVEQQAKDYADKLWGKANSGNVEDHVDGACHHAYWRDAKNNFKAGYQAALSNSSEIPDSSNINGSPEIPVNHSNNSSSSIPISKIEGLIEKWENEVNKYDYHLRDLLANNLRYAESYTATCYKKGELKERINDLKNLLKQ